MVAFGSATLAPPTVSAPAAASPTVTSVNPVAMAAHWAASMFRAPAPPATPIVVPAVFSVRLRWPLPETVPPSASASVWIARSWAPADSVEAVVSDPALRLVDCDSVTASLKVSAPLKLSAAPPIVVLPPASVVKEVSGLLPPTRPPSVVKPWLFRFSACAPLIAPFIASAAVPLDSVVSVSSVIAVELAKVMGWSVVCTVPARWTVAGPLTFRPPVKLSTLVLPWPSVIVPVFCRVVALLIVAPPSSDRP